MLSVAIGVLCSCLSGCAGSHREASAPDFFPTAGFTSSWALDPARSYRTAFDDGATYGAAPSPRPILINVWYPSTATGKEMMHGEYLDIMPDEPSLRPLAQRLIAYEREVLINELLEGDTSEEAAALLEEILRTPSGAVRDAKPVRGPFPLVIYHAGAGSSFEDNAALCEALARAGFVVVGSAFQAADGTSFNIDPENAGRDFEFLIRESARLEMVDVARIGLVGHSAGAHGSLMYGAQPGIAVDAIVSLDTTQDYRTLADPRWSLMINTVTAGRHHYRTPTMFAAEPRAIFSLADTMINCERVYLTLPGIAHNDYIEQGEIAARIAAQRKPDPDGSLARYAEHVSDTGHQLRMEVICFLRAKLNDDRAAWDELLRLRATPLGTGLHVDLMPIGADAPQSAQDDSPTPRLVYHAYLESGVDGAISALDRLEHIDSTLFDHGFVFAILYHLIVNDRVADASRLSSYFLGRGVDVRPMLNAQARFFATFDRYGEFVDVCIRMGRAIAGDDPSTLAMVRELSGKPLE